MRCPEGSYSHYGMKIENVKTTYMLSKCILKGCVDILLELVSYPVEFELRQELIIDD